MYLFLVMILFTVICYSGTQMIVYMRGPFAIFEKFRTTMGNIHEELGELLGCEYCTSIWFSAFISILNMVVIPTISLTPFNLILGATGLWWLIIMLDCLFGSGVAWMLFRIEDALLAVKERNMTDKEFEE